MLDLNNTREKIRKSINFDVGSLFVSLSATFLLLYYYNPMHNAKITSWDRTFNTTMFAGYSISKRLHNFYSLFILAIILFVVVWCLISYLLKNKNLYKKFLEFYSGVNLLLIFAFYISRYIDIVGIKVSEEPFIPYSLMIIIVFLILSNLDKKNVINIHSMTEILIANYTLFLMLEYVFYDSVEICFIQKYAYLVSGIILLLNGIVEIYLKPQYNLKISYWLFEWLPFIVCTIIEILYVLQGRGLIYLQNYRDFAIMISAVGAAIFLGIHFWQNLFRKTNTKINTHYWGFVISLGALINFPGYQKIINTADYPGLFELGNGTCAIETFTSGKVPIIDYFSAHALYDVWTRILYAFINNDIKGIVANPYEGFTDFFALLILFALLKKFMSEDKAIIITAIAPLNIGYSQVSSICFISILISITLMKRNKNINYILFWIIMALSVFVQYDKGLTIGIGCICSIMLLGIFKIFPVKWKSFILSALGVSIGGCSIYSIYCACNNISIIGRFQEWFAATNSSATTWAINNFGNAMTFSFFFSYFIAPLATFVIFVFTVVWIKKKPVHPLLIFLTLTFSIAEILYIPRTIIYHNITVCQGTSGVLFNVFHWTVSIFVYMILSYKQPKNKSKNILIFLTVLIGIISFEGATVTGQMPNAISSYVVRAEQTALSKGISQDMSVYKNGERVEYGPDLQSFANKFTNVFNVLLNKDETFIDFANVTSLYALSGREVPFYVAQSPSLLTNTFSQECWLNEIKNQKDKVPLLVLGTQNAGYTLAMTDIAHNIRYYRIAEYLYQNYRPLVYIGDFAIWCQNDRCEEFYNKLVANSEQMNQIDEFKLNNMLKNNCQTSITKTENAQNLIIKGTGLKPFVTDLQYLFNQYNLANESLNIQITYKSTKSGVMQLFYTTQVDEEFNDDKVANCNITNEGIANFSINTTANTRLRLDIPEDSEVTITSIKLLSGNSFIDWGYDRATTAVDGYGNTVMNYVGNLHSYSINQLPYVWAEYDDEKAANNTVVSEVSKSSDQIYHIDSAESIQKQDGNYLLVSIEYPGIDVEGLERENDETVGAAIKLGSYVGNTFNEKYQYKFTLKEGIHNYLFRISSDYYWYHDNINAVTFSSDIQQNLTALSSSGIKLNGIEASYVQPNITKMQVLQGD